MIFVHHNIIMDNSVLTRTYLETLSTSDLIALADDYGIDIPPELNRRFIIAELLEAAEDVNDDEDDLVPSEKKVRLMDELPHTYNESQISVVLRNPAWCFVYWDIRANDMELLYPDKGFIKLLLKVSFYVDENTVKPKEMFDIPISADTREQYVFIPANETLLKIELIAEFGNKEPVTLASSQKIKIPQGRPEISSASLLKDVSPILELSGLPEILRSQYSEHRQSFI